MNGGLSQFARVLNDAMTDEPKIVIAYEPMRTVRRTPRPALTMRDVRNITVPIYLGLLVAIIACLIAGVR